MQNHQTHLDEFSFDRMIEVPSIGNSGGVLVILRDDNLLELDDITTTNQEIHVMIKVCRTNISWLFSCIYASNFRNQRNILWENLKMIKDNFNGQWLVGGF